MQSYSEYINFLYYWSLRGRNINNVPYTPVRPYSKTVIEELKKLKELISTKSGLIDHIKNIVKSSHETAILPRYGDYIVGFKGMDVNEIRKVALAINPSSDFISHLEKAELEELIRFINSQYNYIEFINKYPNFEDFIIKISHEDLVRLYESKNVKTNLQDFLLNLRPTDSFKLKDKIIQGEQTYKVILGEHILRTTDAGQQYLRFQATISSFLDDNIDTINPYDLVKYFENADMSHNWLAFYLKSCSNQEISNLIISYGYEIPQTYYELIELFSKLTYGQYQKFILDTQLLDLTKKVYSVEDLSSVLMWNGMIGKLQEQAILIKAGLVPSNPVDYGLLETVATHQLLKRTDKGALICSLPDFDELYPELITKKSRRVGSKAGSNIFGLADFSEKRKWRGSFIKTFYIEKNEVFMYYLRKMRDSRLLNIEDITEINNKISNDIGDFSWIFSKIKDVPSSWYSIKNDNLSGQVGSTRGAYNLLFATPSLFTSQAEMNRYLEKTGNIKYNEIDSFLKSDWLYLWNCIMDIKNALDNTKSVTNEKIMKLLKQKIPEVYQDFALIVLRNLLF
ncbi:MAG: hypothetical protein ACTSYA_13010 [Candidatus Kariarchaeaceae archaeon]